MPTPVASAIVGDDLIPTIPIPTPVASTTPSTAAVGVPQSENAGAAMIRGGANNRQQMEQDSAASQRMSFSADNSQEE